MISLRKLKEEDALLMLEWMHDPDIQKGFKKNMLAASLDDTTNFCRKAIIPEKLTDGASIHYAIVDENDEYLGTVSLKDISLDNKSAEYAITLRKKAQGKGIAYKATGLVLKKAFEDYDLHRVYLSVIADNDAAIRLYERSGFTFEGEFRDHLFLNGRYKNWKWYSILRDEYNAELFEVKK